MEDTDDNVEIRRFPINEASYTLDTWKFKCTKSHILSSKCTGPTGVSCSSGGGDSSKCQFCIYTDSLNLPHLPDMVFASNIFTVTNEKFNCAVEFNALDSLALVINNKLTAEVACSEEWKESRTETGYTNNVPKLFDWTFTTNYKGSLKGEWKVESSDLRINMEKLRRKDKILFFHELTLFEDELHDNGISQLSVKVRVMQEVFFILLRYFLRVDNVLIKIIDTRYYHEFGTNHIVREHTVREAKVADLNVPPHLFLDPNDIAQRLPLTEEINEQLTFSGPSAD